LAQSGAPKNETVMLSLRSIHYSWSEWLGRVKMLRKLSMTVSFFGRPALLQQFVDARHALAASHAGSYEAVFLAPVA
jgi:hypothetical protein